MAKWKDSLYFSKGDRIAIILLLVLICIAGGISIYLNNFTEIPESYISQTEKTQKDFREFEETMEQVPFMSDNNKDPEEIKETIRKPSKNNSTKLNAGQIIDINSASANTLTRIPGIGATLSARIIEYRTALGGFYSLEQLQEIKGITINKFSQILPYLIIKNKHKTIDINKVSSEQLAKHPYLNEKQIRTILTVREKDKINSWDDLSENKDFTPRDIQRLSPYFIFK